MDAEEELNKLSETASPEQIKLWNLQADEAESNRSIDYTAMDIYEAEVERGL